jgi:hypothetical protein
MLAEALITLPESFPRAGWRYAVVPVQVPGCFHPKVLLRLGADQARVQISSANATTAGWCRNLEICSDLSWSEESGGPDNGAYRQLIRKSYDSLVHWLGRASGDVVEAKLHIHRAQSKWLFETGPNAGPISLSDGTAVDFLFERADGVGPNILQRFMSCVSGDRIHRIVVVSPYWDSDAGALQDVQDAFGGAPLTIGVNPASAEFPAKPDLSHRPISFATDEILKSRAFAHAKLVVLEGDAADHVLSGSANLSRAALGSLAGVPARNAEASVYRRLPPGTVLKSLGLSLDQSVERARLKVPERPSYLQPSERVPGEQ